MISNFIKFNKFKYLENTKKTYILLEDLYWDIGKKNSGWQLLVKKGTKFDISVPVIFEWIINPHDRKILLSAAIHDELLNLGHDVVFASAEFRRSLEARGVSSSRAWLLFFSTLLWTVLKS